MTNSLESQMLFHVKNIRKTFQNGNSINYQFDLSVKKGGFTIITGGSGVGKSTLLHILGLLDAPEKIDEHSLLEYYSNAHPINYFELFESSKWHRWKTSGRRAQIRREDFGFLPQGSHLLNTFAIRENLELILQLRHSPCMKQLNAEQEILTVLNSVGFGTGEKDSEFSERLKLSPLTLSGGQKQRLALARTIICDCQPKVIFVDEPTTYMDEKVAEVCLRVLADRVIDAQCSVILVTHDKNLVTTLSAYIQDEKKKDASSLIAQYHLSAQDTEMHSKISNVVIEKD